MRMTEAEVNEAVEQDMRRYKASDEMRRAFEWDRWVKEIPAINFPAEWWVKVVPPYTGAVVRFHVYPSKDSETFVSVYLDCYEMLGVFGKPYWEAYPIGDDVYRCAMNDTDSLLQAIKDEFER